MQTVLPFSKASGAAVSGGFHSAVIYMSLTCVHFLLFVNYLDSLAQTSVFLHVYDYKYLFKSLLLNKIQLSTLQSPMLSFITHI